MPYGYAIPREETPSAVTSTPSVKLGERTVYNNVEYVYVYNACDSLIYPGNGVIMTANSGYSVMVTSVAGDACFGVCVNATASTGSYFWLAQRGLVKVRVQDLDSAAVAGEGLILEDNGEFRSVPHTASATTSGATGRTYAYQSCGHIIDSIASGSSGYAWIRCP